MTTEQPSITTDILPPMGRLENGRAAPYNFSIFGVCREAWSRVKGFKRSFWAGFFIYVLMTILCYTITSIILNSLVGVNVEIGVNADTLDNIRAALTGFLVYPLFIGILMLGVEQAADLSAEASSVTHYYSSIVQLTVIWILWSLYLIFWFLLGGVALHFSYKTMLTVGATPLAIISLILGILSFMVGIYIYFAYLFAPQLYVEKRLGIFKSLKISRKAVNQHFFKILFIYLLTTIIFIISAALFMILFIWTLPWACIVFGILYRIMFGVDEAVAEATQAQLK